MIARLLARTIAVSLCGSALVGCGPSSELDRLGETGPLTGPFYVSEHFSPSGHMGDGETAGHIFVDIGENCLARPAGAGGDCYRFVYEPGAKRWAGVYWAYPANNWGSRPGRNVASEYSRIRFYAAADRERNVEFKAGIKNEIGLPFKDNFQPPSIFPKLTTEYQQFSVDLSLENIDSIIGAFAWVFIADMNADPATLEPVTIYLDDIVWE